MIEDFRKSEFYRESVSDEEALEVVGGVTSRLNGAKDSGFAEDLRCLIEFVKCGSWSVRMLAIAGLFYFLQPFDLLPDYIPLIGWADDIIVVAIVAKQCSDLLNKMLTKCDEE